jgi:CRISPR/Cas system-associated protein Cas10 (large subunit of type III CRISPR-Cas system)
MALAPKNESLLKVRLCALLHDIGKPLCWGMRKSWSHHVTLGRVILEHTFGKEFAKTAVSHHTTQAYDSSLHPSTTIEKAISVADHIASGADRPRDEDPTYGGAIPPTPVVMTHPLAKDKTIFRVHAEELVSFTEDFEKRFRNASVNEETFMQVFDYLSRSVLKRIPADTRQPYNDVSLFDHLRLTAAIANCIWSQGYKNENVNSYRFSVLCADADRISAYINRSSRLPDLRGGSLLISQAVKKASDVVRRNLGSECVIFEGGGGFLALADPKFASSVLQGVVKEFNDALYNDTTISIASINDVVGFDLQRNFAEVWGSAIKSMHDKKLGREEKMIPLVEEEEKEEEEKPLCDICKIRQSIYSNPRPLLVNTLPSFENVCGICQKRREMGRTGRSIDSIADNNDLIAVLKMDGDDMGELISGGRRFRNAGKLPTPSRISTISRLVHDACESKLRQIVESERNGGLIIYAGGDDMLAILPANKVFDTAIEMQQAFSDMMGGSATMSAGISIFDYKIPIYAGLESVSDCLYDAKNNEGKSSVAFDVLFGVSGKRGSSRRPYRWNEFKDLLDLVQYMKSSDPAKAQIRGIVERYRKSRVEAELLVKYNIGRKVLDWHTGHHFLNYFEKQDILKDAFIIYNITREREEKS